MSKRPVPAHGRHARSFASNSNVDATRDWGARLRRVYCSASPVTEGGCLVARPRAAQLPGGWGGEPARVTLHLEQLEADLIPIEGDAGRNCQRPSITHASLHLSARSTPIAVPRSFMPVSCWAPDNVHSRGSHEAPLRRRAFSSHLVGLRALRLAEVGIRVTRATDMRG